MATEFKPVNEMSDAELNDYNSLVQKFRNLPMGLGGQMAINLQAKGRPKYKRNPVYDENIALAKENLNAPDREAQFQKDYIDQASSDAMNKALGTSSSTSGLLNLLANLTGSKTKAYRGIAQDQATLRQQKLATLMGANVMGAEEADKEWNYNVNEPYQMQLKSDVDREKYRQEHANDFLDFLGSLASSFLPGAGNLFKGGKSGGSSSGGSGGGQSGYAWDNGPYYEGV